MLGLEQTRPNMIDRPVLRNDPQPGTESTIGRVESRCMLPGFEEDILGDLFSTRGSFVMCRAMLKTKEL